MDIIWVNPSVLMKRGGYNPHLLELTHFVELGRGSVISGDEDVHSV